jgi:hypothetical protein
MLLPQLQSLLLPKLASAKVASARPTAGSRGQAVLPQPQQQRLLLLLR